jgi:DNA transformation protein and related proteins
MSVQPQYLAYILEQLSALPALRSNRMFGGVGLYSDGLFFGLIDDDTLFFKTSEANIQEYQARKMPRFMPFPDRPESVLGYHQVPADIIEDVEALTDWARKAVSVALSAQAAKAARPRKKASKKPAPNKKATARKKPTTNKKPAARKMPAARRKPARKK